MDPERWQTLESLFDRAAQLEGVQRRIYLQTACAHDHSLFEEVESLLGWHEGAASFLRREVGAAAGAVAQGLEAGSVSQFRGAGRFQVKTELGRGGFGIVYEAWDTLEQAHVALKTLRHGLAGLREFRREFRALAGLSHPNLVPLYELFTDEDQAFFTMEVVRGCGLVEYATGQGTNCEAVIDAVRQLAEGIAFLHDAGKLHRDLKPANVLVTLSGRVVILDFGLVLDVDDPTTRAIPIGGTPAFMAPEQRLGQKLAPASDWFSFGVILSRLAASGDKEGLLISLARDLTRTDPSARPGAEEVFRRLGRCCRHVPSGRLRQVWTGRKAEIDVLRRAFHRTGAGSPAIVAVEGEAGIGKTALVTHFLDGLIQDGLARVLHGRCHERESSPYKAWDEVADQIVRLIIDTIPDFDYREIAGFGDLCRVFPVFAGLARSTLLPAALSADQMRERAFGALRSIVEHLAARRRLVIFLDDLHYADADSAALLRAFLGDTAPAALWILASRQPVPVPASDHIVLEGLTLEESHALATSMAGTPEAAPEIAGESAGNPQLISELVLYARSRRGPLTKAAFRDVIAARLDDVPADLRRIAEIAAVAGHPLEWDLLCQAAARRPARTAAIAFLSNIHLLRGYAGGNGTLVELYHDRVRESVTGAMTREQLTADHALLARVLESQPEPNAAAIAVHYEAGGQPAKAGLFAAMAASRAESTLAFESAARFWRMAVESGAFGADEMRSLRFRLASALGSAGHGAEAASVYLGLAEKASRPDSLDLRRRAAEQYLISGHMELGLKTMGQVFEELGLSPFSGRLRALGSLLWQRIRLLLSRPQTRTTPAGPDRMLKLDACWSVAQGLALVDLVPAAAYHTLHLRLARSCGDPYRLARAMAIEAGLWSIFGVAGRHPFERALERARKAAALVENPHPAALVILASGVAALARGEWRNACRLFEETESALSDRCSDVAWSLATARLMHCVSLFFLGDLGRLNQRLRVLIRRADARGDRYEATDLRIRIAHVTRLAEGDAETASLELKQALGMWPSDVFLTQHWWGFIAAIEIHLYCGDGRGAWQVVVEQWAALRRSMLLLVQYTRVESLHHRALAAVACAAAPETAPGERRRLLRRAARDAARLRFERADWSLACAVSVRAAVAALHGSVREAADLFADAERRFRACDMAVYAAAARFRYGKLLGGARGSEIAREAADWMSGMGVAHPELFVRVFAGPPATEREWTADRITAGGTCTRPALPRK